MIGSKKSIARILIIGIAASAFVLVLRATVGKSSSPEKPLSTDSGITYEEDKALLPFPPNSLEVFQTNEGMRVTWPAVTSDRIGKYRIYRRAINSRDWQLIATIPIKSSSSTYSYLDRIEGSFEYAIASITIYDTEGPRGPVATPVPLSP